MRGRLGELSNRLSAECSRRLSTCHYRAGNSSQRRRRVCQGLCMPRCSLLLRIFGGNQTSRRRRCHRANLFRPAGVNEFLERTRLVSHHRAHSQPCLRLYYTSQVVHDSSRTSFFYSKWLFFILHIIRLLKTFPISDPRKFQIMFQKYYWYFRPSLKRKFILNKISGMFFNWLLLYKCQDRNNLMILYLNITLVSRQ